MASPTAAASVVPLVRRFASGLRLRSRTPSPTLASLEADVLASRILFLGEIHHEPDVLRFQLAVLDLAAKHGPVHLVLESFALPQQPLLDSFFASPSSPSQDAFAAEYEALGGLEEGFDAVHYRSLLSFLRDHHAGGFGCATLHHRAFAGFPARPEARRFVDAPEGLAGPVEEAVARGWVDAELQRRGLVVESSRAHRMLFAWLLRGGGPEESDPPSSTDVLSDRAARIFPAQVFKDSVMATQVVRALRALEEAEEKAGTEAEHRRLGRVVAVCGAGHCDFGLGVPERVDAILRGAARHADGGKKTEPPRTLLLTVRSRGPRGETGEAARPVVPVTFPGGAEGVAVEEVRFVGDYVYDFVPAGEEEEEEEAGVR